MASAPSPDPVARAAGPWPFAAAVVAAGLLAWWGCWHGGFLFDDHVAIEQNEALQAGDWWRAAFAEPHQPLSHRPLTTLSLAIDRWLFGPGPFGPHLVHLGLHLVNALLLLGILRRALLVPKLRGLAPATTARGSAGFAGAIALLWVVHPLCGDAVLYATQRSTLLFSGCLLLALYGTVRAQAAERAGRWRLLVVAASALGMAAKEDMVVGPLLVVLFEGAVLLPGWSALRSAMRRRPAYYAALAASYAVLLLCAVNGPTNATVGYDTVPRISALEWLYTQAGVVLHYLRLVVWPSPLRGAYDWDYVRDLGPALLPGALVLLVLGATQLQWRRRPWWAWLGLSCFLLLAPTSTVLPIRSEVVAERRMYLPMLLGIVAVVAALHRLLRGHRLARMRPVLLLVGVVLLALLARQRVAVYRDEPSFWADAYARRTPDSRSHLAAQVLGNHAAMLFQQGRHDEASALFDEMMRCEAPTTTQLLQYAASQQMRGNHGQGLAVVERLVAAEPDNAEAQAYLGISLTIQLTADGNVAPDAVLAVRAEAALRRAVELQPRRGDAWNALGFLLLRQQRWAAAEIAYARATELSTAHVEPFVHRAELLRRLGRKHEIGPLFARLLADPRHAAQRAELERRARELMR